MKILLQINDNVLMMALIRVLLNEMEKTSTNTKWHQQIVTLFLYYTGCGSLYK